MISRSTVLFDWRWLAFSCGLLETRASPLYRDAVRCERADKWKRALCGNTFTYMVIALAIVVENLRKMLSYFKDELAVRTLNAKINGLPQFFCQAPSVEDNGRASHLTG